MKTLKANNFDQVVKELEGLGADKSVVKNEIKECDKKLFHVVTVRIEQGNGLKNKGHFVVNKYHRAGYEKIMKSFVMLGYHKVILLHDPTVANIEDTKKIEPKKVETQEEIQKRIEAEVEKRVQAQMEALKNKGGQDVSDSKEDAGNIDENDGDVIEANMGEDYWGQTIDDMKNFAKDQGIDLTGLKKKEDIKGAILEYLKDNKEN